MPATSRRFRFRPALRAVFCASIVLLAALPAGAQLQGVDPLPAWPLCGDLYETSPYDTWDAGDWLSTATPPPCDSGRWGAAFSDELQVPYGPRRLNGTEYDWHRGIDVPTRTIYSMPWPPGINDLYDIYLASRRPVFAVAAGTVIECEILYPNTGAAVPCTTYTADTYCQGNPSDPACPDPELLDLRLLVEHERAGNTSRCHPGGCYYSRYTHLSKVRSMPVDLMDPVDVPVAKGEFLGLTGQPSGSVFNHLHFEIRSAVDADTDDSQREAINPLAVLPRPETASGPCADDLAATCDETLKVAFEVPAIDTDGDGVADDYPLGNVPAVDLADPLSPVVTVKAWLDVAGSSEEQDLDRVEVKVSALQPASPQGMELVELPQGYDGWPTTVSATPEGEAWLLYPPFLDLQGFNRQYTYKHETSPIDHPSSQQVAVLYDDFLVSGSFESPWASCWDTPGMPCTFPATWGATGRADYHLTETDAADDRVGHFNGLKVWAARFSSKNSPQELYVKLEELAGSLDDLCIEAFAYDLDSHRSELPASSGPCAPPAPSGASFEWPGDPLVVWDPVLEAGFYRLWWHDAAAGEPERQHLIYEGPAEEKQLGRPRTLEGYNVEACYASAPPCAGTGEPCPTAQCSPLTPVVP